MSKTAPLEIEKELRQNGFASFIGLDEAGRGAWAGGIAVGAVQLPLNEPDKLRCFEGVRDSKDYRNLRTASANQQRQELAERIRTHATQWAVGWVDVEEIDAAMGRSGLALAQQIAVNRALSKLNLSGFEHGGKGVILADSGVGVTRIETEYITPDGGYGRAILREGSEQAPIDTYRTVSFEKGDVRSLSIAASSILAKVYRDEAMIAASRIYPGYGFESNKGYGSFAHTHALDAAGVSPLHRKHYAPIAKRIAVQDQVDRIAMERGEAEKGSHPSQGI